MYLHIKKKSVCLERILIYLAKDDALLPPPCLMMIIVGSKMKPWLIDGNKTKSSSCSSSSGSDRIIIRTL